MGFLENLANKELPPAQPVPEKTPKQSGLLFKLGLRRGDTDKIDGLDQDSDDDPNRDDKWNSGISGTGRRQHG